MKPSGEFSQPDRRLARGEEAFIAGCYDVLAIEQPSLVLSQERSQIQLVSSSPNRDCADRVWIPVSVGLPLLTTSCQPAVDSVAFVADTI